MPDLTTKEALLERMVKATDDLKTDIPAKFDDYLPLSGGTITGSATISGGVFYVKKTSLERGVTPSTATEPTLIAFVDKNDVYFGAISFLISSSGSSSLRLKNYSWKTMEENFSIVIENASNDIKSMRSSLDDTINLGSSSVRWKQLYAGTATINTSDERLKDNIEAIPDEVLDAWGEVNWYQYQFKDSIAEKGENARIHTGAIAQRIESVFKEHGLDANSYGLLCYDEWDAEEEVKDEDGNIVQEARKAGNRYALRYEEALCMEAAYQRRRADRIEARLDELESKRRKSSK